MGRSGWIPIGTEENPFTGSYDGSGYFLDIVIAQDSDRIGFFGVTSNAELKNIDVTIRPVYSELDTIGCFFGNLVGHAIGGSITNCFSQFSIHEKDYFGGLVGVSSSTITNCGASGGIIHRSTDRLSSCIGGLVGENDGVIQNSFSMVGIGYDHEPTVSRNAGGIAGINTGTIQNCVSSRDINNDTITGTCHRIVATNTGTLIDNYAWDQAKVLGSVVTGGSLTNEDGLDIATDGFTAAWWENLGFVFDNRPWHCGTLFDSKPHPTMRIHYYNLSLGITPPSGFAPLALSLEYISKITPDNVTYEIAYESRPEVWVPLASGITATCSVSVIGIHRLRATATFGLRLYHMSGYDVTVKPAIFAGGDGSPANPFRISTPHQLCKIADFPCNHFMIVNDIDLTGYPTDHTDEGYISSFIGVLDGMGCIISGLSKSLFGGIGSWYEQYYNSYTEVRNIRISDVNIHYISNNNNRSGLVGAFARLIANKSLIEYCSVENGKIICPPLYDYSNDLYSAGFVGEYYYGKNNIIRYCHTNVDIISGVFCGGFVGHISGNPREINESIHDCYCTGNVTGIYTGGFHGSGGHTSNLPQLTKEEIIRYASVRKVYMTGNVHSTGKYESGCRGHYVHTGGFSSTVQPYADNFVVLCPSIVADDIKKTDRISRTHATQEEPQKTLGYGIKMPISCTDGYDESMLYSGTTISTDEAHTKSWWQNIVGFEFIDTNPNAPWTWDTKTQLPIIIIPRKPIPPLEGDEPDEPGKSTVHDWNLRGVYPLAERGLMWGYWGTQLMPIDE